ncbi:type II secretion system protein [Campylobacter canadensis]|uniref:type II secretion system protein n=1 Tax=Campylobacter canadensis TaxID=449520 RepID=UPI001551B9E9|nr:type II secretion system protein [Campylobacter canadensis]
MKKGFTMIELIFVIVILGILAAVAIPKINATRDDAEKVKSAQNIVTLIGDLGSYYTAQGKFATKTGGTDIDFAKMTNVAFSSTAKDTAKLKIGKDDNCLTIKVDSANGKVTFTGKTTSPSKACEETLKLSTVKAAFGNKDLTDSSANTHTIDYSASGVKLDF